MALNILPIINFCLSLKSFFFPWEGTEKDLIVHEVIWAQEGSVKGMCPPEKHRIHSYAPGTEEQHLRGS